MTDEQKAALEALANPANWQSISVYRGRTITVSVWVGELDPLILAEKAMGRTE